jgi:hypothetical protein
MGRSSSSNLDGAESSRRVIAASPVQIGDQVRLVQHERLNTRIHKISAPLSFALQCGQRYALSHFPAGSDQGNILAFCCLADLWLIGVVH